MNIEEEDTSFVVLCLSQSLTAIKIQLRPRSGTNKFFEMFLVAMQENVTLQFAIPIPFGIKVETQHMEK
eukprot:TRINITY_DN11599_c0_g1_i1.p3 TRINITY_DN11599_c0_g1~~TRINITY_DN11599_c0_g1_i1.p3  ORF type:complete len:69 (+),score=17.98 TRINITY_DN11599_c0_g1_i1:897-1103(+)